MSVFRKRCSRMVLHPVNRIVLKRLRGLMKREEAKSGKTLPRAMKLFGRLKNVDERIWRQYSHLPNVAKVIAKDSKKNKDPGYAVRVLKVKGTKGVVVKYPTLANEKFHVSPLEEIVFVRKMVGAVNSALNEKGVLIRKPVGHPVGPFIVMGRTNFLSVDQVLAQSPSPSASKVLVGLAKGWGLTQSEAKEKLSKLAIQISLKSSELMEEGKVVLSKKYPANDFIKNEEGITFLVCPLDFKHLQIMGIKKGVLHLVPYIDAI